MRSLDNGGGTPRVTPGQDPFRAFLDGDGVALVDGAMGTELYKRGIFINRPFEELNLTQPGVIREVHEAYLAAGADVLETNTFTANRFRLSPHGLADKVAEINRRGVELAREAAAGRAWVAGAMGPLGVRIEPFGPIGRDEAREVFREQAQVLAEAGVDLFILETFGHLPELEEAIAAIRQVSRQPIVAEVAVREGGLTREGVTAFDAAERLEAAGADVVGVNCSDALAALQALGEMRGATELPLSGMPNAGAARSVEGRKLYLGSPDYFVAWARRAIRQGARLVGGCCGTGPDHIRAARQVIGDMAPPVPPTAVARERHHKPAAEPVPRERKSVLAAALAAGRFVTGVEVPPVRGWVADDVVAAARQVALAGANFLAIPEGPAHIAHLPPLVQAQLCRQVGVATLIQYSVRGRRLPRIQSDLLGAYASGVTNLLLVTGDPLVPGVEPDAWPDLEIDSIGAVNLAARLNYGEDLGGNPIGRPTAFHIGVHLDPTAHDVARERSRFHWKVDAGAEFAITSPIFDLDALREALASVDPPGPEHIPVIATVWPLTSARQAEFFEHQMASVPVPEPLVERMRAAEERGDEEAEGLAIAVELARQVKPLVEGIQVVATDGRTDLALAVLAAL